MLSFFCAEKRSWKVEGTGGSGNVDGKNQNKNAWFIDDSDFIKQSLEKYFEV